MITDIHTHVVPASFPKALRQGPGGVEVRPQCDCGRGEVWIDGRHFRTVSNESWAVERRIEVMDRSRIGRQLLSPMPELLGHWLPAPRAADIAAHVNAELAEMVARGRSRFLALGMVTMQEPERAAAEIEALAGIPGFCGIEIGTNVGGVAIGDPRFEPAFAAAVRHGMAVFVHALRPAGIERLVGPPQLSGLVGFPCETALAAVSAITGGLLRRHPGLRIAFSHGGGALGLILPRLERGFETIASLREAIVDSPAGQARQFYYDTLVFDAATLRFLIDRFGVTQLCIGTDRPFALQEEDPVGFVESLGLSAAEEALVLSGNAARYLGEKGPGTCNVS
jgi:aminocarboxymuconate-semialdehyde decarboxylase